MKAVIFDMDDTLYKENRYRLSGFNAVADCFAAACRMTPGQLYQDLCQDPSCAFEKIVAYSRINNCPVSISDQLAVYRSHRPDITLDNDASFVLDALKQRQVPVGLITDGRAIGQLNKIAALQLSKFISESYIIATVLHDTDKHSAQPFEMLRRRMAKAGVNRFVYVGDNPGKDFRHPNLMGWDSVMLRDVTRQNIHRQDIAGVPPEYRPRITIDNLKTLLNLI